MGYGIVVPQASGTTKAFIQEHLHNDFLFWDDAAICSGERLELRSGRGVQYGYQPRLCSFMKPSHKNKCKYRGMCQDIHEMHPGRRRGRG